VTEQKEDAMSAPHNVSTKPFRVSAEDVLGWLASGEPVTILDDRAQPAYEASRERIRGEFRVDHYHFRIDPSWPRERITVAYCT
jgi:hypothetical protein